MIRLNLMLGVETLPPFRRPWDHSDRWCCHNEPPVQLPNPVGLLLRSLNGDHAAVSQWQGLLSEYVSIIKYGLTDLPLSLHQSIFFSKKALYGTEDLSRT